MVDGVERRSLACCVALSLLVSHQSSPPPCDGREALERMMTASASSARTLLGLLLFGIFPDAIATWDEPAEATLADMLHLMTTGQSGANFFYGDFARKDSLVSQKVAGCILDKVSAIREEDGFSFINDLQIDLASCCTKGDEELKAMCGGEEGISEAYAILHEIQTRSSGARKRKATPSEVSELAGAAKILLRFARRASAGDESGLTRKAKQWLERCPESEGQEECDWEDLGTPVTDGKQRFLRSSM